MESLKSIFVRSHVRSEFLVYVVVWGVSFLLPWAVELYKLLANADAVFDWGAVLHADALVAVFFALFVFNDLFLSPLVVVWRRLGLYVLCALAAVSLVVCVLGHVGAPQHTPRAHDYEFQSFHREPRNEDGIANFEKRACAPRKHDAPGGPRRFWGPLVGNVAVALLVLCFGVLVKVYLLAEDDKKRIANLSHERTAAELALLRYQLSPHFMMNTLNNIHALVDIDAERAKLTIEQMSKLLRYMLYDSNKPLVDLADEVAFLSCYIDIMRIRFTSNVAISVSFPSDAAGIELPPLLFVNMVENAFKHGVSYAQKSFVDVTMTISSNRSEVSFVCANSVVDKSQHSQNGIGLANVRKRLDLLCAGRYVLSASQIDDRFVASLSVRVA